MLVLTAFYDNSFEVINTANAQGEAEVIEVKHGSVELNHKVEFWAEEYGVSASLMKKIITCETAGKWDPKMQSDARYKKDRPREGVKKGQRELSFGLAMIHQPAHPHIKRSQATDPDFAIKFLAENMSKGNVGIWSCYKLVK